MDRESTTELAKPRPLRDARGYWLPGQSGNPGGRPGVDRRVRALAQKYGVRALKELFVWGLTSDHGPSKVAALREVLDRAFGRAPAALELSGPDGGPIPLPPGFWAGLDDAELKALRSIAARLVEAEPSPGDEER